MDCNFIIGERLQISDIVTFEKTASAVGSGGIDVYATPSMIALMEKAALTLSETHMPEENTTVGINVNVDHLEGTPLNMKVSATATLTAVKGKILTFEVVAEDESGIIGKGTHIRAIINKEKFLQKLSNKIKKN